MRSIHFTKSCEIFYLLSGPDVQSGLLLDTALQKSGSYDLWINLDQHVVEKSSFIGTHLFTNVHLCVVYGHLCAVAEELSSSNRIYSLQC